MRKDKSKRVLLAGATGYLGNCLLRELKAQGFWVRVLIREESQKDKVCLADDFFIGQLTNSHSIKGIAKSIDHVYSTVGITRQKDNLTYMEVDYQANLNLLREVQESHSVEQFLYVSAINGQHLRHLKIFEAKEAFVDQLKKSGIKYRIIRPNGFFSDMRDFLEMAKRGKVYLFGSGQYKLNPIAGEDLAQVCIDKMFEEELESNVGGPEIFTQEQIASMAIEAIDKPIKIVHIPDFIRMLIIKAMRLCTTSKTYGPYEFFLTSMGRDNVAPCYGTRKLKDFYVSIV